ncbi:CDP-glycerol:poly(glycerophosphate) glycerophosphotransferase [Friedmanniella luteola]|uniref:CDP-glycerol:poly(Glycerophosphate) glycerophosphotransferase n=1 Tax=Friedmanniella luteola TaxID=546871 RepID=A0A1H1YVX8_9ACTN|nr:CDP-glycerol glycerophosphotransferase family protein [Friedmanniella luteola]SDT25624.1 CDP-glycerol:poly(glycerophosphate) glycerophosphotransferase [Friedmanniella luteola]
MKVVYNSFNGRYADNPRAVFEGLRRLRPGLEHVWLADPRHAGGFPDDVATVPIRSRRAVAALEQADVLVANCHTDLDRWTKRPEQVYLQTWHGTPLKRIHRSALQQPDAALMDALDDEIERWDHLISPSPAATDLLRSAFGYRGAVLETGYPRNDLLTGPGAADRRARARARLGLADGVTVVLWAPTYRDDDVDDADVPDGLDAAALADRLGPDVVVLLRRHYYLGHRSPAVGHPRVRDLSDHPDIGELHLAADVLVTDYSSSIFDFVVTGRPVVVYAYDLEHFRDRLRGFTLDLETELPGPVVQDQDVLADVLAGLPDVRAAWSERYAAFRERFCALEDGRATERVVEALWPHPRERASREARP